MTTNTEILAKRAAWQAARDRAAQPGVTVADREAAKAAWAALEAVVPRQKVSSTASRAGRRQAAALRSMYRWR